MPTKYLLTCVCGTKHAVEIAQAGTVIHCACGRNVDVPTYRGLTALPRAEETRTEAGGAWTRRHGLMFLGLIMAVVSLVLAGYFWLTMPPYPEMHVDKQRIRLDLDSLSIDQTVLTWEALRLPLDESEMPHPAILAWHEMTKKNRNGLLLAGGWAIAGLVLFVSAWLSKAAMASARGK